MVVLTLALSAASAENAPPSLMECGSEAVGANSLHDYRSRDRDAALRWSIADINRNHYDLAAARMADGEFSRRVMADINYLLLRWPNHYPGLQLLIQYESAGGKPYEYPIPACYFVRARDYFPDDVNLLLAQGFYYWKKHDLPLAIQSYSEAVRLDPESAAAHYNLGLALFDAGQHAKALTEARAAYAAGYPLSGLRTKLERAGEWSEQPVVKPTDGAEAAPADGPPH